MAIASAITLPSCSGEPSEGTEKGEVAPARMPWDWHGLAGIVDDAGTWIVTPRYQNPYSMFAISSDGASLAVAVEGLTGIAEPGGVWVLEPLWADVSEVRAGMVTAASHQAGPWGIGRPDGSWQIAPKYTSATWLPTPGTALVSV